MLTSFAALYYCGGRGCIQLNKLVKSQIGKRLRFKREQAGYTREQLAELCSLSPRFIANIEFGESTFSLDSLMAMCRALSCSSDYLLFGDMVDSGAWSEQVAALQQVDTRYQGPMDKILRGVLEIITEAERKQA